MPRLNQIIALSVPAKARTIKNLEEVHRGWNKNLIAGMSRTYKPLDEDGDMMPPEMKLVQLRVVDALKNLQTDLINFYDIVATQETGNTTARADIVIGGRAVITDVPVTVLLFLEKQLATNIIPFLRNLPTLPSDKEWHYDESRGCFVTEPTQQNRTQKIPQTHVLHPPTAEHPAQCEMYHVDKPVGTWTTTHFSGAMKASDKAAMLERAEKLQDALKSAREEANSTEVKQAKIGQTVWDFVFGKGD